MPAGRAESSSRGASQRSTGSTSVLARLREHDRCCLLASPSPRASVSSSGRQRLSPGAEGGRAWQHGARKGKAISVGAEQDGLWYGRLDLGRDLTGKRKSRTVYSRTREGAAAKLQALLDAQGRGLPVAVDRATIGGFLDEWLERSVWADGAPADLRVLCPNSAGLPCARSRSPRAPPARARRNCRRC